MEQATNLFTKGLLLDTHPMVLSNDTLTDCLNGTLITMNGNEVILQNDMGNRRVDKAYLPPGYEPVGIKEYGGIIYVASYNPITNKSQIGSFPSPLKKISSNTNGDTQVFDFQSFTDSNGSNVEHDSDLGIDVLKSDSFMIPLTKDLNLRAGDKFAVYSEGLSLLSSLLTNYNNTSDNKAYSPKNRKYTLQLGVLNSLNEFADITKTLCRWKDNNGWKPVNYSSEVSEVFKFNDGYFISDAFTNTFLEETIEDAKLIKERLKIAANTYSYKLVGPLYLKIMINHIENFNYNIYGTYDNGEATLWIEGYLTYNCPDGYLAITSNSNENYATFSEGIPSDSFGFDLYGNNSSLLMSPDNSDFEKSIYNPNNNTYSVKIVKKYTNITGKNGTTIFDYVLGVKADIESPNIYLKGISAKGSIDLSLLGSGILKFNGWRFYNKNEATTLTFAFNAYPEYGKSFTNLRFKFVEHESANPTNIYYPVDGYLPVYNGKQTIKFSWNEVGLSPRKTYKVYATYQIWNNKTNSLESNNSVSEPDNQQRWFLTTELFNDFYSGPSAISDFCTTSNLDFLDKMKINIFSNTEISDYSKNTEEASPNKNLIGYHDPNIDYSYIHTHNIKMTCKPKLQVKDADNYPDYVTIILNKESNVVINSVTLSSIGNKTSNLLYVGPDSNGYLDYSSNLKEQLQIVEGRGLYDVNQEHSPIVPFNEQKLLETSTVSLSDDHKTFSLVIKHYDVFNGYGEAVSSIKNAFSDFSEILTSSEALPFPGHFAGVVADFDSIGSGSQNKHYIEVATKLSVDYAESLPRDHDIEELGWIGVDYERGDEAILLKINNYLGHIFRVFNENVLDTDITFLYFFCNLNSFWQNSRFNYNNNSGLGRQGEKYTRAWWKMPNGEWACFLDLYHIDDSKKRYPNTENFANFIKSQIGWGGNLVYCMYDDYSSNEFFVAKTNCIYYDRYSIPMTYNINYNLDLAQGETPSSFVSGVGANHKCGNLLFSVPNTVNISPDTVEFMLNSSEKFYDDINFANTDTISNVYLGNGKRVDSMGRSLNAGYVYLLKDDELVRIDRNNFYVDSINKTRTGKNKLLYNAYRSGSVNFKYQHASSSESETLTVIEYSALNIVSPIML